VVLNQKQDVQMVLVVRSLDFVVLLQIIVLIIKETIENMRVQVLVNKELLQIQYMKVKQKISLIVLIQSL